jgi:ABC-2 type transport system permease protein
MRKILRLALREYLAAVKTKAFIIGLVLAPVLMSGGLLGIALLRNQVDTKDKKVAVLDRAGVVAPALLEAAKARNAKEVFDGKTGKKLRPAYVFESVKPATDKPDAQRLELSNQVRDGKLQGFLEIGAEVVHPAKDSPGGQVAYYAKNAVLDDLYHWLQNPVNDELRRRRLADAGIDPAKVKDLFNWVSVQARGLSSLDAKTGQVSKAKISHEVEAIIVPMMLVVLMFMLMMMGTAPLLQTVMEEKTLRIAEVLLGAVTPFQFMMGKILGGLAVSLTGSVVYVLGAVLTLTSLAMTQYIPYHQLGWFFVWLLAAIFMQGAVFAALGSACNDAKDAQNMQLPAMLPFLLPMFVLMPVLKEPQSAFSIGASFFPPFTPIVMLLRQSAAGGIPAWQPWVGLVLVTACAVLAVWVGGRVFRVGILMQGKPPKLSDLVRWAVRG